jgi:hypothetical protein
LLSVAIFAFYMLAIIGARLKLSFDDSKSKKE